MRTIAFVNQKGGVGKSTTAVNVSAGLARLGHRVLLIDLDPQAHATVALGLEPRKLDTTVYSLLAGSARPSEVIRKVSDGLSIMPSNIHLAGGEAELASQSQPSFVLKKAMTRLDESQYDYAIVDSPPQLGFLNVNSLAWVREVYIPVTCEFYALHGLSLLLETVERVRARINPDLRISGVVTCLVHPRRAITRAVLADLEKHFPGRVLKTRIRVNVRLVEAPSHGKPIFDYAPESNGALDYMSLSREIVETGVGLDSPMVESVAAAPVAEAPPVEPAPALEEAAAVEVAAEAPAAEAPTAVEIAAEAPLAETPAEIVESQPVAQTDVAVPAEIEAQAPLAEAPAESVESEPQAQSEWAPETSQALPPAASEEPASEIAADASQERPQDASVPVLPGEAPSYEAAAPADGEPEGPTAPAPESSPEESTIGVASMAFAGDGASSSEATSAPEPEQAPVAPEASVQPAEAPVDEPAPASAPEDPVPVEPEPVSSIAELSGEVPGESAEPQAPPAEPAASEYVPMPPGVPLTTPVAASAPSMDAPVPAHPSPSSQDTPYAHMLGLAGLKPIVIAKPGAGPASQAPQKNKGGLGQRLLGRLMGRKD